MPKKPKDLIREDKLAFVCIKCGDYADWDKTEDGLCNKCKPKDCQECANDFDEFGSTNMCDSCERKAKKISMKGNENDCICHKPKGKHIESCDAYRLSQFLIQCSVVKSNKPKK